MWTAIVILLWLLAAVLALLLAALAMPLRIEFRATASETSRYCLALRPFGAVGPRIAVVDSDKPSRKKAPVAKDKKAKTGKKTRSDPKRFAMAIVRFITDIFDQLHIKSAVLDLRFGTSDPAETGQIYGALTPFIYGTCANRRVYLNVEPVFDGAVFDGRAALDVTLTPARLIPPFVRFGWAFLGPNR